MAALSVDGTPMPALPNSADQINYDNTTSGLSATTVKGAVDELASEKQDATDNNLTTTNKTIVGGINELKSGLTNKVGYRSYYSQAETTTYSIPITRAAAYIIAVNIPTGANTANPGLYYVIKQGSSVTKSDLITDVLGLAVSITDSNLVLSWTVSNFYGANIIVIPVYEFT